MKFPRMFSRDTLSSPRFKWWVVIMFPLSLLIVNMVREMRFTSKNNLVETQSITESLVVEQDNGSRNMNSDLDIISEAEGFVEKENSESNPIPKVAICFVGGTRTMVTEYVMENTKKNLIDEFNSDVFLHVHRERENNPFPDAPLFHGKKNITFEDVLKVYNPVSWSVINPADTPSIEDAPCFYNEKTKEFNIKLTRLHHWKIYRNQRGCYNLVKEYENKHGFKYDFIIRTRPDLWYGEPMGPLPVSPEDSAYRKFVFGQYYVQSSVNPGEYCQMSDFFNIVPRPLADAFFTVEQSYRFCEQIKNVSDMVCMCNDSRNQMKRPRVWATQTECMAIRHLASHNVGFNIDRRYVLRVIRWPKSADAKSFGWKNIPWV